MALQIIKDPVTGKQYSRDDSVSGSTFSPYQALLSNNGIGPTAPSSTAGDHTAVTTTQTPNNPLSFGDITNAVSSKEGTKAYMDIKQQASADIQSQADKNNQMLMEGTKGILGSLTSVREQATADTGIIPKEYFEQEKKQIAAIESLTKDYNAVVAAKDKAIAEASGRNQSKNSFNNETAQIERNYAPKLNNLSANINAQTAVLQASQGMFAEAQNYINQAVQDATAMTRFQLDALTTYYQANEDSINRLDASYKDSLKTALEIAQDTWQADVKEKENVGSLMIDFNRYGAGILMSDTLEQATAKAAAFNPTPKSTSNSSSGVTASSGFTSSKIESDVRADAGGMLDDGLSPDEAFTKLRLLYSPQEVSDDGLKALLGIGAPVDIGGTSAVTPGQSIGTANLGNTKGSFQGPGFINAVARTLGFK